MISNNEIRDAVEKYEKEILDFRRTIHSYAEIGGEEFKTRALIIKEAEKLQLPYELLPDTGVIVVLDTGREGRHIACRADMDALPMPEQEQNTNGKRTCISSRPDCRMHACGHDAHTAMLLGAMNALSDLRDNLNGIIYFCFEQGEEESTGIGIKAMMKALDKYHIDGCWGMHVTNDYESGTIAVAGGPVEAGCMCIDIRIEGKGGHGSRPDKCINPLFAATAIVTNLAMVWPNQVDANEAVTLGITSIECGSADNVIADEARILGTVRFFNPKEAEKVMGIVENVTYHTAEIYRCKAEVSPKIHTPCSPLINDYECAELAEKNLGELFSQEQIVHRERSFGSETFSRFTERYPGVFVFLGTRNEDKGATAGIHNTYFDIDEAALQIGAQATVKYVAAFLEK